MDSGPFSLQPASAPRQGLPELFWAAFTQSRNAMVLIDERRRLVDVNGAYLTLFGYERGAIIGRPIYRFVAGGPLASPAQWKAALRAGRFTGQAEIVCANGLRAGVQWAATTEVHTGRQLTLFVALGTSRWGSRFRRTPTLRAESAPLSAREREIVRLVALGNTGPEIADQLQIAHDTVRTHVRNAMGKTDSRSRAHLVAKALGLGLALDWSGAGTGGAWLNSGISARPASVPQVEQRPGT